MPNLTIYVDAELAAQVRALDVPISATCQAALRRRVQRRLRQAEIARVLADAHQSAADHYAKDQGRRP